MSKRQKFNPLVSYSEQPKLFKHSPALSGDIYSYVLRIAKLTKPIQDYLSDNILFVRTSDGNFGGGFNPFKSLTAHGMRRNDLYKLVTSCRGNGTDKRYMVDHQPIEGFWEMGKMTVLELQTVLIHAYALSHSDMVKSLVSGDECNRPGQQAMIASHGVTPKELSEDLGYTVKGYQSGDHADKYAYARALLPPWFEHWIPDDAWEAFVNYLCYKAKDDRQKQIESDLDKASVTINGKRYQITELVHLGGNQYRITTKDELPGDENSDGNPPNDDNPDSPNDDSPDPQRGGEEPDKVDNHETAEKLADLFQRCNEDELSSFINLVSGGLPGADSEALTPDLGFTSQESDTVSSTSEVDAEDTHGKFIDLFAGVGGFRLGFEDAGYECVFSSEIDPDACDTYEENHGDRPHGDITQIDPSEIPAHDVILAGFPCQPFSVAGNKKGLQDENKGHLFYSILEIAKVHKPSTIVLENVKNVLTTNSGRDWEVINRSLNDLGYEVSYEVLNACDFGVPQNRERVFIVADLNRRFDFSLLNRTQSQPLSEHLDKDNPKFIWKSEYKMVDDPRLSAYGMKGVAIRLKQNGELAEGQGSRIYSTEGYHPTLTHNSNPHRYLIYLPEVDRVRALTARECFTLQGFPKSFKLNSSDRKAIRQAGNSVCVPIIREIARVLANPLPITMTPKEYQETLNDLASQIHLMKNPDEAPKSLESLVGIWANDILRPDKYVELPYHLHGGGKQWQLRETEYGISTLVNVWDESESIRVPSHWVDKYALDPQDLDQNAPQLMSIIGDVMSDYGRLRHQFKGSPTSLNSYIHKRELQAAINMEVSERKIPNGYLVDELQEGIERAVKYNHILESMSDARMVYAKHYPKSDWTEELESFQYQVFVSETGVKWRPIYCTPSHVTAECELPRTYTKRIDIDSFRSGFTIHRDDPDEKIVQWVEGSFRKERARQELAGVVSINTDDFSDLLVKEHAIDKETALSWIERLIESDFFYSCNEMNHVLICLNE